MKIVLKNVFMYLVVFWKCYFPTSFSHFLTHFLSYQTKPFSIHKTILKSKQTHSQIKTILKETKIKTKSFSIHKTIWSNWEREEEERVIANRGKGRGRLRKREISHGRRDRSSGGRLQAAPRLRRKEFDLEGSGTISQCDLGKMISLARSWQCDLGKMISLARSRRRKARLSVVKTFPWPHN